MTSFPPVSATDNGKVLTVADGKWAVGNASGGTTVVANPTLAGTEADLTGLQVGDTKYKVPAGGGGGSGGVLVVGMTVDGLTSTMNKTWQEIHDADFAVIKSTDDFGMTIFRPITSVANIMSNYNVTVFNKGGEDSAFLADSANGYPSRTESQS